ncbi:hypothetical protein DFH29DRAFT_998711 [Suillus ampliporus]|nr:hypothetical protein DFH29DRAFT_998711 [Suillus ampliporus]
MEARTYDKSKIWMNPALACLIEDSFWSAKGDAVRIGKKGNTYLELPDPLLSICATAIKCAFKGIRDICSMKGIVHFTDAVYGPEWCHYMELLEKFKNDSPTYYGLIKLELQDMLWEHSKDVASFLDNEASIANTKIDFNAMEEAAKAAMAARKSK